MFFPTVMHFYRLLPRPSPVRLDVLREITIHAFLEDQTEKPVPPVHFSSWSYHLNALESKFLESFFPCFSSWHSSNVCFLVIDSNAFPSRPVGVHSWVVLPFSSSASLPLAISTPPPPPPPLPPHPTPHTLDRWCDVLGFAPAVNI